ncbi:hypothetical protein GQ54DRAFT_179292 [Martensiomyces pterosporus]|nr:hypothetical protein GQ54DRAFT_179292 [Martensiomyces pterosporus]
MKSTPVARITHAKCASFAVAFVHVARAENSASSECRARQHRRCCGREHGPRCAVEQGAGVAGTKGVLWAGSVAARCVRACVPCSKQRVQKRRARTAPIALAAERHEAKAAQGNR